MAAFYVRAISMSDIGLSILESPNFILPSDILLNYMVNIGTVISYSGNFIELFVNIISVYEKPACN